MQGIYKITNKLNNKCYIGKSIDIERRWIQHKSELNRNEHCNSHFQNAWNKYGEENFDFEIICETSSDEEINEKEIYFIDFYNALNEKCGYNIRSGGEGGRLDEDTKQRISVSHRGIGSSLSVDEVKKIKMALYCLMDRKEISEKFDINEKVLSSIACGKTFDYVYSELNEKTYNLKQSLIDDRNKEFLHMYDYGITITEISNKTGYSTSIVEKCIYKYRLPNEETKNKYLEIYSQVMDLHEQGVIDYQISKRLGISPSTVGRYLRGENHPLNMQKNKKITDEISKKIYDMYFNCKISSTKIGRELGLTDTTVMSEVNKYKFVKSSNLKNEVAFSMQ